MTRSGRRELSMAMTYDDFDLRLSADGDRLCVTARYEEQMVTESCAIDLAKSWDIWELSLRASILTRVPMKPQAFATPLTLLKTLSKLARLRSRNRDR